MKGKIKDTANIQDLSDEELVLLSRKDQDALTALITRYLKMIRIKAAQMCNFAVDHDDLAQEGLLGFLSAVSTFNPEKGFRFSTYADVCVTNKMKTAQQKSNRTDLPFENVIDDKKGDSSLSPEQIVLMKDAVRIMYGEIQKRLSVREWRVFKLYINGSSYEQMASALNVSKKSIDNTIQRMRYKLKTIWKAE